MILDGAMGSMIQAWRSQDNKPLEEKDFRGDLFAGHPKSLRGCNDVLCLTRPDIITGIHEAYLEAGADIIETCSLNSTSVGLADYGLEKHAFEISRAAASLARKAADKYTATDKDKPRFVAGSMGNTPRSAVFTPDMDNPGMRQVTWDELEAAYYENARGLVEGGADFLLIETIFDGLNAKAALAAIGRLAVRLGRDVPAMVCATVTENGRLLTGQTVQAFCASMLHANPLSLGLNCSFGIDKLRSPLEKIAAFIPCPVIFYPNAGMPDSCGHYSDTPDIMAAAADLIMKSGLVNIIGGCCGSTPAHIAAIAKNAQNFKPREFFTANRTKGMHTNKIVLGNKQIFAGTQIHEISLDKNYLLTVSNKIFGNVPWQTVLDNGNFEEAIEIARETAEKDLQFLAVCTDKAPDPLAAARNFIFLASAYSDLAVFPVFIKSSRWDVIEEGFKCFQGCGLYMYTGTPAGEADAIKEHEIYRCFGAVRV